MLDPLFAILEPFAGVIRLPALAFPGPDLGLGIAEILRQRDLTGADHVATAALDTAEKMVRIQLVEFIGSRVPVELLRQ